MGGGVRGTVGGRVGRREEDDDEEEEEEKLFKRSELGARDRDIVGFYSMITSLGAEEKM